MSVSTGRRVGKISQVIGSTFDAEFAAEDLPPIYNAVKAVISQTGSSTNNLTSNLTDNLTHESIAAAAAAGCVGYGYDGVDISYGIGIGYGIGFGYGIGVGH